MAKFERKLLIQLLVALLIVIGLALSSEKPVHAKAMINSCSSGYSYLSITNPGTKSNADNGKATLTSYLMEKYYTYNHNNIYCGVYHADTWICPNSGHSTDPGQIEAWVEDEDTNQSVGDQTTSWGTSQTSCREISSKDFTPNSGDTIYAQAGYGILQNGKYNYNDLTTSYSITV